ncbi:hypothetical protein DFH05DRAFT_1507128 [Lentinula detonsa]|uniref:DUF2786 domain-containing protein n=1 Tax=Lentinula detonsa TaxID=2804962 RepID=A0A9W8TUU3_9AGAR|nr:hypothetical protein DFH05DRAFT_1507128 [Lentinula detonsa]
MPKEFKRQKRYNDHDDYDEGSDASESDDNASIDDDDDDDFVPTRKAKAKKKPKDKSLPKPPSKATVTILADEYIEGNQSLENVDQTTLERVKKALNLSRHPETTEHEAHQALRLAMKLMEKLNVTQAQVLESMEGKEERLKQAGQSVVTVSCQEGKNMYVQAWAITASRAISRIFDVKHYTKVIEKNRIAYTFYGLAPNTVSAAHAFEMVYNLIMQWRITNKEAKGMNAKNAYCRGVADGLHHFSVREKKREKKEAKQTEIRRLEEQKKAEELQRQKEIERLELSNVKTNMKIMIEDEAEEGGNVNASNPFHTFLADPDEYGFSDDSNDAEYDFGNHRDDKDDAASDLREGLDTEEAREEDAVAPDLRVKEEVYDIDLDELQNRSDERARKQAENPELALYEAKKERDIHRVKKENREDETMQDVKPKVEMDEGVIKTEQQDVKVEEADVPSWQSAGALIAFRETSVLLANEYLKNRKLKLRKRRKQAALRFNDSNAKDSYDRGWEDSKKIDLKRKRIKAADED